MDNRPSRRRERRWSEFCRRLDRFAEWANPVLLAVAAVLLILDLSCFTASRLSRLPMFRAGPGAAAAAPPAVGHFRPGIGEM